MYNVFTSGDNQKTMDEKWSKVQFKKILVIFVILIILRQCISLLFKIFPHLLTQYSFMPILIVFAFTVVVGIAFVVLGIRGLVTGKSSALSVRFSNEYKLEKDGVSSRRITHEGPAGLLRSVLIILIGLVLMGLTSLIVFTLYQSLYS